LIRVVIASEAKQSMQVKKAEIKAATPEGAAAEIRNGKIAGLQ
jgi:hypothetical protein